MKTCKFFTTCGGCNNLNDDYNKSLLNKTNDIKEIFKSIDCEVSGCVGNYYPYKYRNKVHLAFHELKGKMLIGFFEEGSKRVVDIDDCLLYGDWLKILISILREFCSRFKLRAVNSYSGGILKFAHARCIDNKLQLTLVVTTDNFPGRDWLLKKLKENFSDVSFYLNINKRTDNMVLDKNFKFIGGNKYLTFEILSFKISIEPSSFLQVNLPIATKMYKKANELLDINPNSTVIDLYSGIGITSMLFAKNAKKVVSCEEVMSAVNNAKYMAKINNVDNIEHNLGKCEDVIDNILKCDNGDVVVFVDPARMGLKESVCKSILKISPRKIVYMSCNPDSCLRDIKILLSDNKYDVCGIYPYDIFAGTDHTELLICLEKRI